MPRLKLRGARIVGISAVVPSQVRSFSDDEDVFGPDAAKKIQKNLGVHKRHVVTPAQCTSDLCTAAAETLLEQLDWRREDIDGLFLVTQTPDAFLPASACTIHQRLGLSTNCATFDINLGCSGYVYGLWQCAGAIQGGLRKVLLLAGDTITKLTPFDDSATGMLFGDAGTATALEAAPNAEVVFELGTDGTGCNALRVPGGGFRMPAEPPVLQMDGAEVFAFTLKRVPSAIMAVLEEAGWDLNQVDAIVPHQASRFILKNLARRLGAKDKVILGLGDYGNTSCASIPLAIVSELEQLRDKAQNLVLCGFGVGLSWGAAALSCGPIVLPPVKVMDEARQ